MNINENRTQTLYNYDKVKDLKKKATIWTAHSFLEWVLLSYAYIEGFICIWKNKSVSVKFNALQNFVKH